MTLKERFKQWLDTNPREQLRDIELEKIADDFSIGFSSFLRKNCEVSSQYLYWLYSGKKYTETELLKIYKKEKGL